MAIRNSNFELLRLILMVMIIIHHCIAHGLALAGLDPEFHYSMDLPEKWTGGFMLINCLCICAVNCFVLISGYFGIHTNKKKVFYLVFALIFYTIIFNVFPNIVLGKYFKAIKYSLFLSHSNYWFVIDYLFLMVFAPMINMAFDKMSKCYINIFIIGLIVISVYFGFVWGHAANKNGYTLLQFILMYCIGRFIAQRKYSLQQSKSIALYLVCSLICGFLMWGLWSAGYPLLSWRMTYYNNPFIILSSIGLFLCFKDYTFVSKRINTIAQSAFGIYLFQSSAFIGRTMYTEIHKLQEYFELKIGGGYYVGSQYNSYVCMRRLNCIAI